MTTIRLILDEDAYAAGSAKAKAEDRAYAFGAIRRAVTSARRWDAGAVMHGTAGDHATESRCRFNAEEIRYAIRRAIESPWTHLEPGMSRRTP